MKSLAICVVALLVAVFAQALPLSSPDLDCKVSTKNPLYTPDTDYKEDGTPIHPYLRSGSKIIKCDPTGDGCNGYVEFEMNGKPLFIVRSQSSVGLFNGTFNNPYGDEVLLGLSGVLPKFFVLMGSGYSMRCDLK
ncbi:MAG: hypothetical protein ACK5P6_01635 [Pseudobdellovibrionaceae bacterium]